MIQFIFTKCNWGVDNLGVNGGVQINVQDTKSEILVHVPFDASSTEKLIRQTVEAGALDEEAKRRLAPLFNGGIVLPGEDHFRPGPQG